MTRSRTTAALAVLLLAGACSGTEGNGDPTPDAGQDVEVAPDTAVDQHQVVDTSPGEAAVDAAGPTCTTTGKVVTASLTQLENGYDLALDSKGAAHAIYIDKPTGQVRHVAVSGSSVPDGSAGAKALVLAAAFDDADRLHVLYVPGASKTDSAYLISRDTAGKWDPPFKSVTGAWDSADLAYGWGKLYGALTGYDAAIVKETMTPIIVTRTGPGTYSKQMATALIMGSFKHARVAAGKFSQTYTAHRAYTGITGLWAANMQSGGNPQQIQVAATTSPAPMAVDVDVTLQFHLAWVAETGQVEHATWDGSLGNTPTSTKVTGDKSAPRSVDIAVDDKARTHVVYRTQGTGAKLRWARHDGSTFKTTVIDASAGVEARIAVAGKTVHFLYEDSSKGQLLYACRTF